MASFTLSPKKQISSRHLRVGKYLNNLHNLHNCEGCTAYFKNIGHDYESASDESKNICKTGRTLGPLKGTVRHVTGTGSGLLGGIPRVVVQISALTKRATVGVRAPYATRRKLRYEANQVWI